ncbi:MAG: glycosyltransferase family 39 protein [Candidatus Methanoperedens sp.]|nr:glycosyltransferase family 39 protein [Candidatus Methanoperedens sp.]CAG0995647.1 hypothetical protein METP1_02548 [Methanosarcinales archaeon]
MKNDFNKLRRFWKKEYIILIIILFLGLFLRVYCLNNESLWLDEGFSVRISKQNISQIVEEATLYEHPPLYYFILHYWINFFGDSEFSTRFLSVIFGFLTIIMIYVVGSLIFDIEVGILGSILLGISLFHVQYAQEVRSYTLMSLLTLLSMYFLIKFTEKNDFKISAGYVFSSGALIYTHIFGLFIIIAQNIYILICFKNKSSLLKKWFLLQVMTGILFIPWSRILISNILEKESVSGYWIPKPSISSLTVLFTNYSGYYNFMGINFLLISFLVLSLYYIVRVRNETNNSKILLSLWLLIPIILPLIISMVSTPIFNPIYTTKYTIGASIAFYLLVAKGIKSINYKYLRLFAISIIIIFSYVGVWGYYNEINKEQWRDLVNYVDTKAQKGDLLLFNDGYIQENGFDYYSKRIDLVKKPFPVIIYNFSSVVDEKNMKELKSVVNDYNRVWLIKRSSSSDRKGLIRKTLEESYIMSYSKNYVGIEVYLFEKNGKK